MKLLELLVLSVIACGVGGVSYHLAVKPFFQNGRHSMNIEMSLLDYKDDPEVEDVIVYFKKSDEEIKIFDISSGSCKLYYPPVVASARVIYCDRENHVYVIRFAVLNDDYIGAYKMVSPNQSPSQSSPVFSYYWGKPPLLTISPSMPRVLEGAKVEFACKIYDIIVNVDWGISCRANQTGGSYTMYGVRSDHGCHIQCLYGSVKSEEATLEVFWPPRYLTADVGMTLTGETVVTCSAENGNPKPDVILRNLPSRDKVAVGKSELQFTVPENEAFLYVCETSDFISGVRMPVKRSKIIHITDLKKKMKFNENLLNFRAVLYENCTVSVTWNIPEYWKEKYMLHGFFRDHIIVNVTMTHLDEETEKEVIFDLSYLNNIKDRQLHISGNCCKKCKYLASVNDGKNILAKQELRVEKDADFQKLMDEMAEENKNYIWMIIGLGCVVLVLLLSIILILIVKRKQRNGGNNGISGTKQNDSFDNATYGNIDENIYDVPDEKIPDAIDNELYFEVGKDFNFLYPDQGLEDHIYM